MNKLEELKLAYRRTFKTEDGQKVLEDLQNRFWFKTTTFSGDPYEQTFNEGQRATIMQIVRMLSEEKEIK